MSGTENTPAAARSIPSGLNAARAGRSREPKPSIFSFRAALSRRAEVTIALAGSVGTLIL